MELENLALFIKGVENRIEKRKENTTKEDDLEILRGLGFRVDISNIYIKTWVLSDFSVKAYLEQTFLVEFDNVDLDYVCDIRETHWLGKDFFSNGKIDLCDFQKIFNVFWNTWSSFVSIAKREAYYYLKRKKYEKRMEKFKSEIAINYDW